MEEVTFRGILLLLVGVDTHLSPPIVEKWVHFDDGGELGSCSDTDTIGCCSGQLAPLEWSVYLSRHVTKTLEKAFHDNNGLSAGEGMALASSELKWLSSTYSHTVV